MVKLRKSLLGLKASGPLGAVISLSTHGNRVRAGKRAYPFNPQTSAQVSHRTLFLSGVEFWHTLTDAEKRVYAAVNPRIGANPGYLNFMSLWLEGNVPYDRGEGHITVLSPNNDAVGQGAWVSAINSAYYLCSQFYNSSHADGDNISFQKYLDKGTYSLRVSCSKRTLSPIVDVDIDAVEVASFDLYVAVDVFNTTVTQTGIIVETPGLKTITFRVDGKHASSTDYYAFFNEFTLWRTT